MKGSVLTILLMFPVFVSAKPITLECISIGKYYPHEPDKVRWLQISKLTVRLDTDSDDGSIIFDTLDSNEYPYLIKVSERDDNYNRIPDDGEKSESLYRVSWTPQMIRLHGSNGKLFAKISRSSLKITFDNDDDSDWIKHADEPCQLVKEIQNKF